MSGSGTPSECGNCSFFTTLGPHTVCQRHPPISMAGSPGSVGLWPIVGNNDWCGEWASTWFPAPSPSYSAAVSGFANPTAGDVFSISGSASRVVRIVLLEISGLCGSNTMAAISLILRSKLNTGGTPTVLPGINNDNTDPAATAVATVYAAAPTVGTPVGTVRAVRLPITNQSTMVPASPGHFFGANLLGEPITLRGAQSCLCVTTPAINQAVWDISVQWTESAQ